ncbi:MULTISPECIES: IS21 family transposase [Mycolicibacterium]|uniref:IS21 family transposase n=1 Tax=Mycolicibacterium TaxID=1866885 RepID=UPI0003159338|nr:MULTISPECIES: IS21 family transposase [Mycolicibacterium]AIY49763.1 Mobile element protein [Mycobacterium sp. VKM Ac-1817D]OBF34162.1 transposase [Mycolicibacterium peregrinum]WEV30179.1 IS21 family transposase [Mycolicibacterium fortuitum]WEV31615.1 IS21 family transposase [Mycolicibacterium fortuitum]WEV31873.1 IS21 family transposase [Mycolicibacterium fortuitum]
MEDWAEIRRLYRSEKLSQAAIARQLALSRNTVAKALRSEAPPRYERRRAPMSAWAQVEMAVRALLDQFPTMPATVIAQRVGWTGGHSWFAENVARIRPEYAPADPCDRLVHLPGEQVQCDLWFPGGLVPDHAGVLRSFPVLVMVAAHSRFIAAMMIPSRVTGDLLAGMWRLLQDIGAVPRSLLWDNESGIGQRGRLAEGVTGFCGVLGTRLIQTRPYDPESKGLVERANGYLETSFLPGRTFTCAADFNAQLWAWLATIANRRTHASTGLIPLDALAADRAAMVALPPVAPTTGTTVTTRLGRDYYVSCGGNAYSVHPEVIGRMITVTTSLDRITAHCGDRLVADHERLWGSSGLAADPSHVAAAAVLREQFRTRPVAGAHLAIDVEVEIADLSAYDTRFGTGEVA